jgi:hypothetical protein
MIVMSKPSLVLGEKYMRILETDAELNKRVNKLLNSFGAINSMVLRHNATDAISETVEELIREKYPDI